MTNTNAAVCIEGFLQENNHLKTSKDKIQTGGLDPDPNNNSFSLLQSVKLALAF